MNSLSKSTNPSSTVKSSFGSEETMTRRTTWPGSARSKDSCEFSEDSQEEISSVEHFGDIVLDNKFLQQVRVSLSTLIALLISTQSISCRITWCLNTLCFEHKR